MGYMRHHAIFVTGEAEEMPAAHAKAGEIFPVAINGYASFFVPPDGSKEGWAESSAGDQRRAEFIDYLRNARQEHRYYDWVEIQYGDDERETIITRHNDQE